MNKSYARPKVSIGLPVYNGDQYLRDALEAILAQSYQDFELIVSDNASTDRTPEICREYARYDSRIAYYRSEENLGAAHNYNRVFREARGTYFKWASANDLIAEEFLQECVAVLDSDEAIALVYPRTILIDEAGEMVETYEDRLHLMDESPYERYRQLFLRIRLNNAMNGMARAEAIRRTELIGPFIGSDITFIAELSLYGKFYEVPKRLFFRRLDAAARQRDTSIPALLRHYDPQVEPRRVFPYWRRNREHFAAIKRSPLHPQEKYKLMIFLLKWIYWEKQPMVAELYDLLETAPPPGLAEEPLPQTNWEEQYRTG